MQPAACCVQVSARLLERCVTKHVLDVMHRPTALDQARTALVTKVMKVQIDRVVRGF